MYVFSYVVMKTYIYQQREIVTMPSGRILSYYKKLKFLM